MTNPFSAFTENLYIFYAGCLNSVIGILQLAPPVIREGWRMVVGGLSAATLYACIINGLIADVT